MPNPRRWAGVKQGFRITKETIEKKTGKVRTHVVHGITSLSNEEADAKRLLAAARGHWSIENGSHYRRDVTLGEDRSRVRSGDAPEILSVFRNAALHLLAEIDRNAQAAIEHTAANLDKALALLGLET